MTTTHTTETPTPSRVDRARHALGNHLARTKTSQNDAAKQLGYSASALSSFLRGHYAGDADEIAMRVEEMINRAEKREELPQVDSGAWRETTIAKLVYTGLSRCHDRRRLGLITGDAGLGKTSTIDHYLGEHRSAVMVRVNSTCSRPHYLLKAIGAALGVRVPASLYEAATVVSDALRGSDRLLILDEAQRLTAPALEVVRDLYDSAKIGIVLVGNQAVQAQVYGAGQAAFAQHFSRLAIHVSVTNEMITLADLELFVGGHIPSSDLASRKYLLELTRRGGFRTALFTLELALEWRDEATSFVQTLKAAHAQRGFVQ
ncbi:MAG: AAA family ATPase [Myxococcales bacterium]|uniref:AAA family ATPase n=1 Tax=Sediminibacterium sp. TaxID=1917865 RepID=UPI001D773EFD|nr:AAA family ATPase [Sediminibacterium sp.]MBT9485818.1 AAA family ATPase [Sediminibacterium sp.]MBT9556838.1 AAA family ATPase [Myxococcales bacterium]